MIPLSLKLVPQQVFPEGKLKTVHILSLIANYTLAEIQRYARIPPGQALLLPPPDTEAPDDLFPQEILDDGETAEIPPVDEVRLRMWDKVKKQLKRRDIQSAQVSLWFDQFHDTDVSLADFEAAVPPAKFTVEMLSSFYEALVAYEEKLRQRQQQQN